MNLGSEIFRKRYGNFILIAVIPVFCFYIIFMVYPIVQSLYCSLFDWSGFTNNMTYIGLNNYQELFSDKIFLKTVWNSLKYVLYGGILIIGITLMFTYAISNYKSRKLKDVVQMILFVPNAISPVALALLWGFILNTRWGLLNNILKGLRLGFFTRGWLGENYIFGAVLSLLVWIHVGFFIVLYMASADRIPTSLYDAAEIDGASNWEKFYKITVPLLSNVIKTSIVLWTVFSFKIFGYIYAFGTGGSSGVCPVPIRNISVQMYLIAFGKRVSINRLGYASAMSGILLLVLALLVYIILKLFRSFETVEY